MPQVPAEFEMREVRERDEFDRCLDLRHAVFNDEKGVPRDASEEDEFCDPDKGCHMILYRGKVVGTMGVVKLQGSVKIRKFCFLPECRGLGLGRLAIDELVRICLLRGVDTIDVDARCDARAFYEKCGFAAVSDVFRLDGTDYVKMRYRVK